MAKKEEQTALAERLENLLSEYPDLEFEIVTSGPILEQVPASLLHCLDCDIPAGEPAGLAKAVSPNEIYQMITDRMVEMIETAGDYKKAWSDSAAADFDQYLVPFNYVSKKPYRGINVMLLTRFKPLRNPYFLTFKQIEQKGGTLKKGSKGFQVVYYVDLFQVKDKSKNLDFGSYQRAAAIAFAQQHGLTEKDVIKIPILKYYVVFNGADIEGIDFKLDSFKVGKISAGKASGHERNSIADLVLDHYPKPPRLDHGGNRAYYQPGSDRIQLPEFANFNTANDYYRTLFHEIGHSTGHAKRLDRDFSGRFGSKKYAFEELIAEWTATFLSAQAGIVWHANSNHAAYLKNWNAVLTQIKKDNKFILRAATAAQKAADFVLALDNDGFPAYHADLKKQIKKVAHKPKAKPAKPAPAVESDKPVKQEAKSKPVPPVRKRKKADPNQLALLGATPVAKPVIAPLPTIAKEPLQPIAPPAKPLASNPKVRKIGTKSASESTFFEVVGAEGQFLQRVERKPVGSVVITMDGQQGAGKTTTLYKFMNAFATPGNSCLFISGEEDPESVLSIDKVNKYLSPEARQRVDTVAEVASLQELYSLIAPYDIIFIDSWQKLVRMIGQVRLDEDLRKKVHGKVFVIIFQQTTEGRTKGGAEIVFDGDMIMKMVKEAKFADNYAYWDKNRYTLVPIETLRYNIAEGRCYNPEATEAEETTTDAPPLNLSFKVTAVSA